MAVRIVDAEGVMMRQRMWWRQTEPMNIHFVKSHLDLRKNCCNCCIKDAEKWDCVIFGLSRASVNQILVVHCKTKQVIGCYVAPVKQQPPE